MQEKLPDLNDINKKEAWHTRPGRSIAEQSQNGLAACRKRKSCFRILNNVNGIGKPLPYDLWLCAVELRNDGFKPSHFYDVMKKPDYKVGRSLPFPPTFRWLHESTRELDPVQGPVTKTVGGMASALELVIDDI